MTRQVFDNLTAEQRERVRASYCGDDDSHRRHVYNVTDAGVVLSRRESQPGTCGRCALWREIDVPARGRCLGPGGITKSFETCEQFREVGA